MKYLSRLKMRLKHRSLGLVLQQFAIILLPLTILLVVITFSSISVHNQAMRKLVGERDERAVSIAASALNDQIESRWHELVYLSVILGYNPSIPVNTVLADMVNMPTGFDAGVAVFDAGGKLVAVNGEAVFWIDLMKNYPNWNQFYQATEQNIGYITNVSSLTNGDIYGLISAKARGSQVLVGAYSIPTLAAAVLSDLVPPGGKLSIMLVDGNHQTLYSIGDLSHQSNNQLGIDQALHGKTGITYVKVGGDEHVTAYSPVTISGWALITDESWESVVTPTLQTSQFALLVLIPAVFIMLLAIWLGNNQVVRPLRKLELKASTLAQGDFKTIQESVGGIAEIQHLQKELILMADKVQEAQRSLHGYIGAITEAQEDERRRLARELHDDTLQALIALKQRVQLAQLESQEPTFKTTPESGELKEIIVLTEQTIENLRRLTRDLRPLYLEDLGLVAALEMLAQETGQAMGITIEFHRQGNELRLDASIELALYRMAQEALSNIVRHANAKRASLSIIFKSEKVSMQISDDGVGFELPKNRAENASRGHYGLLGLGERAELIGATLEIRTSPGKGTHVTVTIPIHPRQAE